MENKEILQKIKSVKYCMMAHPDNSENSEFEDRISDLQEIEDFLCKEMSIYKEFIDYVEQIEEQLLNLKTTQQTTLFDIVQCFTSMKEIIKSQNGIKNEPKEINF